MAMDEEDLKNFDKSTFIADTGASTHMVNSDDGMFDCKEICAMERRLLPRRLARPG